MHLLSRLCAPLLAALTLAAPASATWSILLVDTATKEVVIGSATCVVGINLRHFSTVLVVGKGGATAQSVIGPLSNRQLIFSMLQQGGTPDDILTALEAADPGHQNRQYGIIDTSGAKVTFSGRQNSAWAGGVVGSIGTIHYAIQGNILTGAAVVNAAEQAVLDTNGDLPEKLMAAMEAAYAMGGDGRCSCPAQPTSCGAPPPSFTKSAHVGFMIGARLGDPDGTCIDPNRGCANGRYFMRLNVPNQFQSSEDPVLQLRTRFDAWRQSLIGRPDHYQSSVIVNPPILRPDGTCRGRVTIRLADWQGTPLATGGAAVSVSHDPSSSIALGLSPVVDYGDGRYAFDVTAGTTEGTAQLQISVDDGQGPILLAPFPSIEVRDQPLWADSGLIHASTGGVVNLHLDGKGQQAFRSYLVAASGSGTAPGILFPPAVQIPLNPDPWFDLSTSVLFADSLVFVNTQGQLDMAGRATAQLHLPGSAFLNSIIGTDLDLAFFTLDPIDFASNAVRVSITP